MATEPSASDLEAAALRLQAELLSLPARHLPELPVQTRIVAHHQGLNKEIVLCSGRVAGPPGEFCFSGDELRALALGVEAERLWAWDFTGFCLLKQHDPRFEVTGPIALAGAQPVESGAAWPLGKVLQRLGLVVSAVEIADAESRVLAPAEPGARAA